MHRRAVYGLREEKACTKVESTTCPREYQWHLRTVTLLLLTMQLRQPARIGLFLRPTKLSWLKTPRVGVKSIFEAYLPRMAMSTTLPPSAPPSEEGLPGEVRPRCPSAASLAAGPANLSNEGSPTGRRSGARFLVTSCRAARSNSPCRGESRRGGHESMSVGKNLWIPAYAGMTKQLRPYHRQSTHQSST